VRTDRVADARSLGTFERLGILVSRREIDIQLVEVRDASGRRTHDERAKWLHEKLGKRKLNIAPAPPITVTRPPHSVIGRP